MIKSIFKYNEITLTIALLSLIPVSCNRDFLEDKPTTSVSVKAINTLDGMNYALSAVYDGLQSPITFGRNALVIPDLVSDNEFVSNDNSNRFISFYQLNWTVQDTYIRDFWYYLYNIIARANFVIDNKALDRATLSDLDKKQYDQYLGEAYALRAMAHFALVNFFAASPHTGQNTPGIPYVTERVDPAKATDFNTPRLSLEETYQHIESDLNQALESMNRERGKVYLGPVAVQLLLSRLYLYNRNWQKAITAADKAISSGIQIVPKNDYVGYWEKEASGVETVFEIMQSKSDNNGTNSYTAILQPIVYGQNLAYADLVQAMGADDVRQKLFTLAGDRDKDIPLGYYVNKYTDFNRNLKLLRISEAYLNKIEAEYHTAPAAAARDLTNFAAERDGADYSADTGDQLLADILKERRFELCFEGHRLFDLRRNEWDIKRGANAPKGAETVTFGSPKYYLPIPQRQLDSPNNKVTQNPGY